MTKKNLFRLMKKAEKNGFVQLDNGFKLVTKDWIINNIKSSNLSKENLETELENISETRCYILTYYNSDDTYIIELGYLAKSVAEEIFTIFASIYDDVSIYAYKDDSSYNDDNIWSKIS